MRLIIVITALILTSFPVFADKKFNKNQHLELAHYVNNKVYEVCEVQHDYRFFVEAYSNGNSVPDEVATINVFKGKFVGLTKSNWTDVKHFVNNGMVWPEKSIMESDGTYHDKIRSSALFEEKTTSEL